MRVAQAYQAGKSLNSIAPKVQLEDKDRPIVEYYPKEVDGTVVDAALQQLGFKPVRRPPASSSPTNTIWVGSRVSVEDTKLVALNLIKAGVEIRVIGTSKDPNKANVIQVGAIGEFDDLSVPPWTVNQITALSRVSPVDPADQLIDLRARAKHMAAAGQAH